ncbi:MAG: WXG100 family type VII secretion target [Acholeplasma sp.]|nr:WXG100 family type VII secretion target [Acholeplasma sp.]
MSARNDNTFIDYSAVAASANTIRECSTTMKGIFDDFENKIKQATSDGVFEGQASEAFKERYNAFKTRFDSFTTAVEEFANLISTAKESTEETEQQTANLADKLVG